MSDEWQPTGVWDAVIIDLLLKLEYDPDAVMAMSAQQRIDAVAAAREEGRLDDGTAEMLTKMGILPSLEDGPAT